MTNSNPGTPYVFCHKTDSETYLKLYCNSYICPLCGVNELSYGYHSDHSAAEKPKNEDRYLSTFGNVNFNLNDIFSNKVDINDIAHSLSNINRWTGHSIRPITVAQHSLACYILAPEEFKLHAIMHDSSEFIINDISTHIKAMIPAIKEFENQIEDFIFGYFGIEWPPGYAQMVKTIDLTINEFEYRHFNNRTDHLDRYFNNISGRLIDLSDDVESELMDCYTKGKDDFLEAFFSSYEKYSQKLSA
jgi:hypothetical protein